MKILILGAGLAGLECGRQLRQRGCDFAILEKESQIGGLARTNKTGDYAWDFGVHALYSRHPHMTRYLHSLPLDYVPSERRVSIYHTSGRNAPPYLINYPFEEGIKGLPWKDRWECIGGYFISKFRHQSEYCHLQDWIDHGLGFGIAKHFMTPYNRKIWNCPLEDISMDLVNAKIHPASLKNFLMAAFGREVIGRIYQWKFVYPRRGIQALMDYTAQDIRDKIRVKKQVEKIRRQGTGWEVLTTDGDIEKADRVISTIPLVELLKMVEMEGLHKSFSQLKWNDTYFILVGLRKGCRFSLLNDCHWAFFKEQEIFYRITMMHNFSEEFLPALVAEVTNKEAVRQMSPEQIQAGVLKDLTRLNIIKNSRDVAVTDIRYVPYTYPIPTVDLDSVKDTITRRLERENILLVGRNGRWDYLNMDGILRSVSEFIRGYFGDEPDGPPL